MLTGLAFALGSGVTRDPCYPWITRTLRGPNYGEGPQRVVRLKRRVLIYAGHVASHLTTVDDAQADRARTRIGVGERVNLTVDPGPADWTIQTGGGTLSATNGATVTYTAPERAGGVKIGAKGADGCECSIELQVVEPSGVRMQRDTSRGKDHTRGTASTGMITDVWITPADVSFDAIQGIRGRGPGGHIHRKRKRDGDQSWSHSIIGEKRRHRDALMMLEASTTPLILFAAVLGIACSTRSSVITCTGARTTMTELETKAAQKITEFEARTDTAAALDAAQLLSQIDDGAGPDARPRIRNERVKLWGRLLSAIDAKIDPKFDPSWVPPLRVTIDPEDYPVPKDPNETYVVSIDTLPDPEMRKRYKEKEAKLAADTAFANAQRRIYRTGQQVTEQAKDYFTTVFVRSANSVTTVEACAEAGQWNAARLEQVRSWVRPPE